MTLQYLSGELSLRLGRLETAAPDAATMRRISDLRRQSETAPVGTLSSTLGRALALTDRLCWESLRRGDAGAFAQQAAISAELHEFGACAGLIDEHDP
jgi:hypothetical protein